jgi:hypothetical protein
MARLFTKRFVPEFMVASLDGQMMMDTTVWGNGTVSTIAISMRAALIHQHATRERGREIADELSHRALVAHKKNRDDPGKSVAPAGP